MFTPKLNKPRSRYQGLGDHISGQQSRKRSSIYTPQKNIYTPTGKNSFNSSILQTSRVYEECGQHRLEAFGQSLPILVMECLAVKDKHLEPTVKIAANGWAWLVCGRRLLVWMFKSNIVGKTPPCHELSLPPSTLPHKASLIAVTAYQNDPSSAACLAVSPEGAIRYWNSVAHEGGFLEINSELKGEECIAVTPLQQSFIVATTSSSLLLVIPSMGLLKSRVLRPPQGMLTGISRRMSSFIFGASTPQPIAASLRGLRSGEMLDRQSRALYVLCGAFLQKWSISAEAEKMLYQCNVEQFVRDCFGHEIWHQDAAHLPKLKTWLLDLEVTPDGVLILSAGVNTDVSNQIYYSIGMLHTEGLESPRSFLSFNIIKFTNHYAEEDEDQLLSYRLLLPDSASASIFLYEKKTILCTSVTATSQAVDKLEFYAGNDKIIGAGDFDSEPVFFSSSRGLVSVKSTTAQLDDDMGDSIMETDNNRMDVTSSAAATPSKLDELSMSEEETSRLKAAFIHSCRGNVSQAERIVEEIFPSGMPATRESGSKLDRLVSQLSQEMINDYPASDPRWAESHNSVGSSVSLILIHQLEDKLKAHEYLISFLKTIRLWDRLSSMPVRNTNMPTNLLLCEHAEKLVAARTLRELHTQNTSLVDRAIADVLDRRDAEVPASGLTAADVFYREVSKVHEIFEALVDVEEQGVAGELSPRETVSMVTAVNTIIGNMLVDAVQYRQNKEDAFRSSGVQKTTQTQEYVPWTASDELEGPCKGARRILTTQHELTTSRAIPSAADPAERGALIQQLMELTSVLLDGHRDQLEAVRMSSDQPTNLYRTLRAKYEAERTRLLQPFLSLKQYERAATLAEKYQDFATLVQICEDTDNQDRLQRSYSTESCDIVNLACKRSVKLKE